VEAATIDVPRVSSLDEMMIDIRTDLRTTDDVTATIETTNIHAAIVAVALAKPMLVAVNHAHQSERSDAKTAHVLGLMEADEDATDHLQLVVATAQDPEARITSTGTYQAVPQRVLPAVPLANVTTVATVSAMTAETGIASATIVGLAGVTTAVTAHEATSLESMIAGMAPETVVVGVKNQIATSRVVVRLLLPKTRIVTATGNRGRRAGKGVGVVVEMTGTSGDEEVVRVGAVVDAVKHGTVTFKHCINKM
jgi:hypothetical protein